MANFKEWWYRLVAGGLLRQLEEQRDATSANALSWAAAEKIADDFRTEVNDLRRKMAILTSELKYAQDSRTADAAAVAQVINERMGSDKNLPGKLDILRAQLKQELAYIAYLEENLVKGTTPFNDLTLETRKEYFERVEGQVR